MQRRSWPGGLVPRDFSGSCGFYMGCSGKAMQEFQDHQEAGVNFLDKGLLWLREELEMMTGAQMDPPSQQ